MDITTTSEAWLAALVERIASRVILLLSSFRPGYRPPWMGASYVTQLALARLSVPESKQVLQAVPRVVQLPEAFTQVLLRKADGNPFFLEELTQAAVERSLDQIPEMPEIPETVQAVLAARIDRLPAPEKRLLQVAAVIGQDITLPLLSEVTGLPPTELHQGLHYLQTAEFLYETVFFPTPLYTFKHALTQEVAYQSLLPSTRQPYHQHIAQLLSTRFPDTATLHPERLAHHYTEAGLLAQALPYWQQAGEQAAARSANVEAISHFTRGLEALQGLPVTPARHQHELALQLALSVPLFMLKQNASLVNLAQRVLVLCRELGESVTHYTGLAGVWRFFFNTGQLHKAQELGQQCLTLAQHVDDPALWLEAHTMQGSTALTFGELCCAQAHFQHSVRLYTTYRIPRAAHQVVDPGVLCFGRQAYTLWLLGYADQALAAVNQALALAKATGHTYSLGFALLSTGTIHRWRREIKALQEDMHALLTLARQHAFAYYLSAGLFFQGLALVEQGAPAPGLAQMHEARATWEAQGATYNLTAYYTACAHTYHLCGETEAGLRVLDDATILMESTAERYYEAEVYRLRGELLCHPSVRDTQQAEACFHQACAIAARQHAKAWELRAVMSLCRLWQQQGKHLAARQRLASIYGWFTEGFTTRDLLEARALLDT
jgi:predicted ATPase